MMDRFRLARWLLLACLAVGALLRIVLYAVFHSGAFRPGSLLLALGAGLAYDLFATLILLTPAFLLLAVFRLRFLANAFLRTALLALAFTALFFDAAAQYYFFEEFNARYNHIALDYVLYPTEVFTNIGESYNVPLVAGVSLLLGILLALLVSRRTRGLELAPIPWSARARGIAVVLALCALSCGAYALLPAQVTADRITNEVAHNGLAQLVRAWFTSELDYGAYYRTLPRAEARARAAAVLGFPPPAANELARAEGEFALQKPVVARDGAKTLDVVVVLEESLGSAFIGVLGHPELACSPEFDRWSKEGVLLTNLVANGNRTVRGLEGILCSFVPLPGDSIVKRTRQEHVACLADVFAARGFATSFFYGGRAAFDHMKPFLEANGYREIVEQSDYPSDAFTTAWGVADEFIFDALLARQVRAAEKGERLFATLLSVSNHKPYAVPPGRTARPAGERSRVGAVAYADWAIGRYLAQARAHGILEHTVVLVVGDHGARVYGSEQIPVASYRIPALFLAPDSAWPASAARGHRIETLCSQIDLAPTLLDLAGVSCTAPFFGRDLVGASDGPGRAFVHHDRDVGILTDDALVVLGLQRSVEYYRRGSRADDRFHRVPAAQVTGALRDLEKDATAVFQTADELYRSGRFVLP